MRLSVVVAWGAISLCLGCAGTGEADEGATEDVGTDAAEWFWTGPPPTGIVADAEAVKVKAPMVVALPSIEERASKVPGASR